MLSDSIDIVCFEAAIYMCFCCCLLLRQLAISLNIIYFSTCPVAVCKLWLFQLNFLVPLSKKSEGVCNKKRLLTPTNPLPPTSQNVTEACIYLVSATNDELLLAWWTLMRRLPGNTYTNYQLMVIYKINPLEYFLLTVTINRLLNMVVKLQIRLQITRAIIIIIKIMIIMMTILMLMMTTKIITIATMTVTI